MNNSTAEFKYCFLLLVQKEPKPIKYATIEELDWALEEFKPIAPMSTVIVALNGHVAAHYNVNEWQAYYSEKWTKILKNAPGWEDHVVEFKPVTAGIRFDLGRTEDYADVSAGDKVEIKVGDQTIVYKVESILGAKQAYQRYTDKHMRLHALEKHTPFIPTDKMPLEIIGYSKIPWMLAPGDKILVGSDMYKVEKLNFTAVSDEISNWKIQLTPNT